MRKSTLVAALLAVFVGCSGEGVTVSASYPDADVEFEEPLEDAGEVDAQDAEGPVQVGNKKDGG